MPALYYTIKVLQETTRRAALLFAYPVPPLHMLEQGTFRQEGAPWGRIRQTTGKTQPCSPVQTWCCVWPAWGCASGWPNALGGEGMGLYQLVLAVYSAVRHAGNGGRLGGGHPGSWPRNSGPDPPGVSPRHAAASAGAGAGLAGGCLPSRCSWRQRILQPSGGWGCPRRRRCAVSALGMPWMAVSSVLRGFFTGPAALAPNVSSQLTEQTVRIGAVASAPPPEGPCGGRALHAGAGGHRRQRSGEAHLYALAFTGGMPAVPWGRKPSARQARPAACGEILAGGGRAVLASALHTAENMLVPACLAVYLISGRRAHRRTGAVRRTERHGSAAAYASHLACWASLSVLLHAGDHAGSYSGPNRTATALLDRMLRLTGYFLRAGRGACSGCWGPGWPLALVPKCRCRGFYLKVLAPAMPLMYLESMVDGAMKGVGGAEAGLPLQRVGFHPAHWRGGSAAAAFWHEGTFWQ